MLLQETVFEIEIETKKTTKDNIDIIIAHIELNIPQSVAQLPACRKTRKFPNLQPHVTQVASRQFF